MEDENILLFDETSPLEQSRRSILYHNPRPEETPTYLVELPEKRIDAPRPSTQARSLPRRSTIVNTLQLPDTREAEEQPLEDYVRRNLPSFRKSLTPEDLDQLTTKRTAPDKNKEQEVVRPATAEDIERDLMDNRKRKNKETESLDSYGRKESLTKEKPEKHKVTYQSEMFPEPKSNKQKGSNSIEDSSSGKTEKTKQKYGNPSANQNEHSRTRNEVVVMPALEPISVSQRSPFSENNKSSKNSSYSPVKVQMSIESSDEERNGDEKRREKHRSKKGKSYPSSAKRKSSKESNEDSFEEDNDRTKKRQKKRKHRQQSETPIKDTDESEGQNEKSYKRRRQKEENRGRNKSRDTSNSSYDDKRRRKPFNKGMRSKSSSVCLSGESGETSSDPHIVNKPSRKERRPGSSRKERTPSEKSSRKGSNRASPKSSAKRERNSEDYVSYSKTTNPFGKEEPYSVHYVATKGGMGKNNDNGPKRNKEKRGGEREGANRNVPVKAPRSAKKVVAKRRYHIQIPDHGRPETWFNVRFNMNSENNVEMNYEGLVKINNYYASNNYT